MWCNPAMCMFCMVKTNMGDMNTAYDRMCSEYARGPRPQVNKMQSILFFIKRQQSFSNTSERS